MDYVIIMDVSGDLNIDIDDNKEIGFIPMEYSIGGEMRKCIGPEDADVISKFYNGQRNGDFTQTSQISPYMYEEYLTPYFEKGMSVLYLCLSSGLSSTFQSACMAKESLKESFPDLDLYPVDTLAATGGMGVLAERAVRNKKAGMSVQENYKDLLEAVTKIKHWFLVQDLMYLKRGGRISAATAVVATTLNIKPILVINEEGKLDTVAKKRGEKGAALHLVEEFSKDYDPQTGDVIYVINADVPKVGEFLEEKIRERFPEATIRQSSLCPIIGAHTGPGMAAICYISK